jgi:arylsulfatase A-like enzyme
LKSTGQADNTVIVFMSDNGGIVRPDANGVPTISNNAPLTGEKALLYEGGIRVPLFVWYPEKLQPGVCDEPVVCNDIYPSILQMAGQPLDVYQSYGDGNSLLPLLVDPTNARGQYQRGALYWHYPYYVGVGLKHGDLTAPRSAIRKGDWKLILDWDGSVELYNIRSDISEKSELSSQEPERVAAMFKDLVAWINNTVESRYIPQSNSRYDPQHVQARPYQNIFETQSLKWPTGRSSRVD